MGIENFLGLEEFLGDGQGKSGVLFQFQLKGKNKTSTDPQSWAGPVCVTPWVPCSPLKTGKFGLLPWQEKPGQ